jgi:hypothetical protein
VERPAGRPVQRGAARDHQAAQCGGGALPADAVAVESRRGLRGGRDRGQGQGAHDRRGQRAGAHLLKAEGKFARLARSFKHNKQQDAEAIRYHYDVSNEFYQQFLDPRMVYSCAYFENGDEDLATAQLKKIDHILRKIELQPGQTLLDIGCGWGALVIRAAQQYRRAASA